VKPYGKRIIVKKATEFKTEGGIILTEEAAKEKGSMFAEVVESNIPDVKPGDTIVYSRFSGTDMGKDLLLLDEKDVLAVVEPK
jgi:chaperonin GroES